MLFCFSYFGMPGNLILFLMLVINSLEYFRIFHKQRRMNYFGYSMFVYGKSLKKKSSFMESFDTS